MSQGVEALLALFGDGGGVRGAGEVRCALSPAPGASLPEVNDHLRGFVHIQRQLVLTGLTSPVGGGGGFVCLTLAYSRPVVLFLRVGPVTHSPV